MALVVSPETESKIRDKHGVAKSEVQQCFENREGEFLIEDRPEHRAEAPTLWFVAPTNHGRLLKIVFVLEHGNEYLKSAYEANAKWIEKFERGQHD